MTPTDRDRDAAAISYSFADRQMTDQPETAWQALINDLHAEFDQGHLHVYRIVEAHRAAIEVEARGPLDVERLRRAALDAYGWTCIAMLEGTRGDRCKDLAVSVAHDGHRWASVCARHLAALTATGPQL